MTGHARSRPAESRQASSRARIASATKAVCGKRAGTRKAPSGSLTLQCSKGTAIKPESIIEGRGICPHGLLTTPASRAGVVFCLAGGVLMKLRATDDPSVALFHCALNLKHTTKTRGSRPPTAPYSFTGLKEYAEKGQRCAGHVWVDIAATSIQTRLWDKMTTFPPQEPRLL